MKRWVRILAVSLAAASAVAFSGCSVRAQTAFTVDGKVTTMAQVNDTVNGCATALGQPPAVLTNVLVSGMIVAQISRDMAAEQNVQTSDADLTSMVQNGQISGLPSSMLNDPNCGSLAVSLALQALMSFQMGSGSFITATQSHTVVVNPRFGTWDPNNLTLSGSGSLSQLANG